MTAPTRMPAWRPPASLTALLRHPKLVVAWRGKNVTLMAGSTERTFNTRTRPEIINLIRRMA